MASMAAQINQISKPPVPVPAATAPISTNINNPNIPVQRAAAASTEINQNPFNQNQSNSSNNPFGDNFSMLNDNDIFGLEFDRIRHSNEKKSTNNLILKFEMTHTNFTKTVMNSFSNFVK